MKPFQDRVITAAETVPIAGFIDPAFERVAVAFRENFADRSEIVENGACVAVMIDGRSVVDLWGGWLDAAHHQPWQPDTLVAMMSVGKGFAGVAFAMMHDRGEIDLDQPVARYWPEFAQGGKGEIPVAYILDHRAGLPLVTDPALGPGTVDDLDAMASALAEQEPLWTPGVKAGYHIITQGILLDRIARGALGRTLAEYIREEICTPLRLDYHFGLGRSNWDRCATFLPATDGTIMAAPAGTMLARAWAQLPQGEDFNSNAWRLASNTSGNGHGNARAAARFYAALACGGTLEGVHLLSPKGMRMLTGERHNLTEIMMGRSYHQALGVLRNSPPIVWMGPNPNSFGHHGIGGSIAFADPDRRIGFSYAMNRMHARIDNGPRARRLIEALYAALEDSG